MTLDRAFHQPLCEVQLYCTPDTTHPFFEQCAKEYPLTLMTQHGADLGERMQNALNDALSQFRHAILIGCDCPSLTVDDLQQALTILKDGQDAVIAPAEDGGYVLIGLNAPQPVLFKNMAWGRETVMAETRNRAKSIPIALHELALQWDVDTVEDWARYLTLNA
jgi:rSAM/selenodomain-associated transferase 1